MSRLRQERGMTLVELLIASSMMIVVLTATLSTFDSFLHTETTNSKLNDAQDRSRRAIEVLSRQLRNLASPTKNSSTPIDKWSDYDLVFKTAEPSRRRVRYCIDNSDPTNEVLWAQRQAVSAAGDADPATPPTSTCPGPVNPSDNTQWGTKTVVADHVVNRVNGQNRPMFSYDQPYSTGGSVSPCFSDSCATSGTATSASKLRNIEVVLYVDVNSAAKRPAEVSTASAVYLRNQNQKPTASYTSTPGAPAGHQVNLNGSGSNDPEGRTLSYTWYTGAYPMTNGSPDCAAAKPATGLTLLGTGVTLTVNFNDNSSRWVYLEVTDAGGLCDATRGQNQVTPP